MIPPAALDLTPLLKAIEDACKREELPPLLMLLGTLDASRKRCLVVIGRLMGQSDEPSQGHLFITVSEASTRYPISRSFLYERGQEEGIVTRPTGGAGKVVVNVAALERWLGRRHG